MKHILKLFLLMALCVVMLAACQVIPQQPEEPADELPPVEEDLMVLIESGGNTSYRIIAGDNVALDHITTFINDIKKNTGAKFSQYKHSTRPKDDFEITINATNAREDAAAAFQNANPSEWSIQISGNRVVIVSYSEAGVKAALKDLKNTIKKDADGNWGIPVNYAASGKALEKTKLQWALMEEEEQQKYTNVVNALDALPFFKTELGAFHPIYQTGDNGFSLAIEGATKAEYDTYLDQLFNLGYEQYSLNVLPASKEGKTNVYHTLTSDKAYIFMQWQEMLNMVRVSIQPVQPLPSLEEVECTEEDTVPVTIAQMQLAINSFGGMGYVYQLADGKLIVVDGGTSSAFTSQVLMQYIKDCAATAGMDHPVIAMWIFSHPHGDHIGVASSDFLENAKKEGVEIEAFGYNFAEQSIHPDNHNSAVQILEQLMAASYPDATIYKFHTGQVYHFKGMSIEILATQEEVYPLVNVSEQNDLCVTWRLYFDNGKTAMFLADNSIQVNRQLVKLYGDYLKSDILQVAHHGLSGAELACYQAIDPDVCLWSSPYSRFVNLYEGSVVFPNKENPQAGLSVHQDQWGYGYRYTLNADGKPIDKNGNVTNDPAAAQKTVICAPNLWLLDDSIKVRYEYHNSETTIIGTDLSAIIQRTEEPNAPYDLPDLSALPSLGDGKYDATGYDYKSLDDIPGGIETITNWSYYFG